jgi:hypothetical protein
MYAKFEIQLTGNIFKIDGKVLIITIKYVSDLYKVLIIVKSKSI